jgi:hypothetical protein
MRCITLNRTAAYMLYAKGFTDPLQVLFSYQRRKREMEQQQTTLDPDFTTHRAGARWWKTLCGGSGSQGSSKLRVRHEYIITVLQ